MQSDTPKTQARRLQKLLRDDHGLTLSLGQSLHLTARSLGHHSWEALSAQHTDVLGAPLSDTQIRTRSAQHPQGLLAVTVPLDPQDLLSGNDLHDLLAARVSERGGLSILKLEPAGTAGPDLLLRVTADPRELLGPSAEPGPDGWLILTLTPQPDADQPDTDQPDATQPDSLAVSVTHDQLSHWVHTRHTLVIHRPVREAFERGHSDAPFTFRRTLPISADRNARLIVTPEGLHVQDNGQSGTFHTVTVPRTALAQLLDVLNTDHPRYDAFSPTGRRIQAQRHHIREVLCDVTAFTAPRADDPGHIEYGGTSDINWDTNLPTRRQGRFVYVDETGDEWTANQLTFQPHQA
ncbi:hypothetical protein [Deinococcus soli (ex Cha et al. 2016)]|uniref:Uncharacterized protein n=2 Tax=Deinococcus soli (ex Cha et al. 2016) TaxID=1309411 RepID=A0AAE3XFP3_9DEIO|nr:hypothetical protein [Deinococcus soli (ex Cha et al. 2016)]MDR6218863.1 hypothetical protein [Deinococcus soli (ex Cha et al. 2016)]MDR6328660.1 hypothetical protein [Deinococcus soli (ex Cha et al. 2016)]MDR6751853.1 hypothetical protein [Deinococcus soli (ex Cha et al. 2016)]